MALPPVYMPPSSTVGAADFAELQRRLRQGVQAHAHDGEDAPRIPASALPRDAELRVARLDVESARVGGRSLGGDQGPPREVQVEGSLTITGDLSLSTPRALPPDPEVRTLTVRSQRALSVSSNQINNMEWISVPELAMSVTLKRAAVLLVTGWLSAAVCGRTRLCLTRGGPGVPLLQLAMGGGLASREKLEENHAANLSFGVSDSYLFYVESWRPPLGGNPTTCPVAIQLPPGEVHLQHEVVLYHGGYHGPSQINQWLSYGVPGHGTLTVNIL